MQQIQSGGTIITAIHLCFIDNGKVHIACMPGLEEFHRTMYHPAYHRSNDYRAVTCPACKRSTTYVSQAATHAGVTKTNAKQ